MEEFQHYCYQIPHLAWKAERIRWQREREAAAKLAVPAPSPAPEAETEAAPEGEGGVDGELLLSPSEPALPQVAPEPARPRSPKKVSPKQIYEGIRARRGGSLVPSNSISFGNSTTTTTRFRREFESVEARRPAGQKPLWKTKQMLTVKIGYAEGMGVLVLSAKDADDKLFPPAFLDAKKIVEKKAAAFREVVDADIEKKEKAKNRKLEPDVAARVEARVRAARLSRRSKSRRRVAERRPERAPIMYAASSRRRGPAQAEVVRNELANFTIRRLATTPAAAGAPASDPGRLVFTMLSSDGDLKADAILFKKNPGVESARPRGAPTYCLFDAAARDGRVSTRVVPSAVRSASAEDPRGGAATVPRGLSARRRRGGAATVPRGLSARRTLRDVSATF